MLKYHSKALQFLLSGMICWTLYHPSFSTHTCSCPTSKSCCISGKTMACCVHPCDCCRKSILSCHSTVCIFMHTCSVQKTALSPHQYFLWLSKPSWRILKTHLYSSRNFFIRQPKLDTTNPPPKFFNNHS